MRRSGCVGGNLVASCLKQSKSCEQWYSSLQAPWEQPKFASKPDEQPLEGVWERPFPSSDGRSHQTKSRNRDFLHTRRDQLWLHSRPTPGASYPVGDGYADFREGNLEVGALSRLCKQGKLEEGFRVLELAHRCGSAVSRGMLYCLLKECISRKNVGVGRKVDDLAVRCGYESSCFLASHFIRMYASEGSLREADRVFSRLRKPDTAAWTCIMTAHGNKGSAEHVIRMYEQMQRSNVRASDYTYAAVLKACVSAGDMVWGKRVHSDALETGFESNVVLGSILMGMYAKSGSLEDVQSVFNYMSKRDVVTWTTVIAGYADRGLGKDALRLYESMQLDGVVPDHYTFVSALKACASIGATEEGRQIHSQIVERGLESDHFIASALVDMYVKCGRVKDARTVFDRLPTRDVVTWGAMLGGYVQQGLGQETLRLYEQMKQDGIVADSFVFSSILKACACTRDVQEGIRIHAQVLERGLECDVFVGGALVDMYAKCGRLDDARRAFDRLPKKSTGIFDAMIAGYTRHGIGQEALKLYQDMQQLGLVPNNVTFVSILKACGSVGALHLGRQILSQVLEMGLETDVVLGSALVDMFVKCGSVEDARAVFDRLPSKDVVTWGAMIAGCAQRGFGEDALVLYEKMKYQGILPDCCIFASLLKACGAMGALQEGIWIHGQILDRELEGDLFVGSALVDMYAKCGSLEDARRVFDQMLSKDVVTWTVMILGYADQGFGDQALELYAKMQQDGQCLPNDATFVAVLKACRAMRDLQQGKNIHLHILNRRMERDPRVGNSLVDMYAKCGSLEDARQVFDGLPTRDMVTWSVMISAYAQHDLGQEALALYNRMRQAGIQPDYITLISVLKACGAVGAVQQGKQVHSHVIQLGLEKDVNVGNILVDMYARSGSLEEARGVFWSLPSRNVVTWNALMNGYGQHNKPEMAIHCFQEMQEQGIEPDAATFVSLIIACSLAGLVDKGQEYFFMMADKYGITPGMKHYTCMVDLLARAGRLDEAEQMLNTMPGSPDTAAWMSLLSGCKTYGNADMGMRCFHRLVDMDPQKAAGYVLMSNIHQAAGRWQDAAEVEDRRKKAGAKKKMAKAWIEVNKEVHKFVVGKDRNDTSAMLNSLNLRVKQDTQDVFKSSSLSDKEREDALCGHAEKLALAYGLLNTPQGTTLLVTKNLRMCHHCHNGTKIISAIENRQIIVRDSHRIHHFKGGSCSCGDDH